jgi:biopolymer transport protein ExbB
MKILSRKTASGLRFREASRRSIGGRMATAGFAALALLLVENASLAHSANADGGGGSPVTAATMIEAPTAVRSTEVSPAKADPTVPSQRNEAAVDMSIGALLKRADLVVQLVMSALLLASVACWTIFVTKLFEVARARRKLAAGLGALEHARFLDDATTGVSADRSAGSLVIERLVDAASRERQLSEGLILDGTIVDRYLLRASEIVRDEARRIAAGTGLLATIGATAPFIGLFGTVWGIMNSFMGIARAQTTNLAVVAPGIAEALLATAMGLVAAIPAVIFYNLIARAIKAHIEQASEGSGVVVRLLSRELGRPEQRFVARAAE